MSKGGKHRKTILVFTICLMACLCAGSFCLAEGSRAETVTDSITIKIGYWGMPETEYVTKAEYHWTQLQEDLEIHEQAYSYFRDKENRSYAVIVAAARGFYLEDLLNYAGVNISDIENISFYTNDYEAGAFTSFTPYQLLEEPRYYYDNLASHINNSFNDAGILVGYDIDDSAEQNRELVRTMLALESNWYTYEAGTENTNPVFADLSTGSRFRLLFGQTDPVEMRTNQSAKYVHTIALTIPGSPEIRGNSGDYSGSILLSREIGNHTVSFHVASDKAMLDMIMQKLVWTSSDDRVLRIGNVTMAESAEYDDAVTVTIDYEVLTEGDASIQGSFMGMELAGSTIETEDESSDDDSGERSDDSGNGSDSDGSGTSSGKSGSASGVSGSENRRNLSLVSRDGSVTPVSGPRMAAEGGEPSGGPKLVSMDLASVFETEEMSKPIAVQDKSGEYAPLIYAGSAGLLLMGGIASLLQFKSQLGQAALRFRRKKM